MNKNRNKNTLGSDWRKKIRTLKNVNVTGSYKKKCVSLIELFLDSDSFYFIIAYISLVNVQTNYCNNNLLILDVKQLNTIMKLYYFYALKELWDVQGKIKMYYGLSRVKKAAIRKKSIAEKGRCKSFSS